MTRVTLCDLPDDSALQDRLGDHDFIDCYTIASDMDPRSAAEIITNFPGWVQGLLKLRRLVTAPFGLHNDLPDGATDAVGIFPVESETVQELVAGFDDRHLNFRVSVRQDAGQVRLATWVHPHNLAGRAYLKVIMPFHILISRNALRRVARQG